MQVMLVRLMSKGEYLIIPKGTKFTGSGKLGLTNIRPKYDLNNTDIKISKHIHAYIQDLPLYLILHFTFLKVYPVTTSAYASFFNHYNYDKHLTVITSSCVMV